MKTKNLKWLFWSLLVIILDQLTKFLIQKALPLGTGIRITSFFNIVHAQNFGAAFSFLDRQGGYQQWLFVAVAVIVVIWLLWWLATLGSGHAWQKIGIALIIGGAIGNAWDRAVYGSVIDFLDVYWHNYHWPTFNVADMAVDVGVVCLLIGLWWRKR